MLSRLPLQQLQDSQTEESEVSVFNISQLDRLPVIQNELQIATRRDPILSQVVSFTKYGCPSDVRIELKSYWSRKTELNVQNDCLMQGIRVIVPPALTELN